MKKKLFIPFLLVLYSISGFSLQADQIELYANTNDNSIHDFITRDKPGSSQAYLSQADDSADDSDNGYYSKTEETDPYLFPVLQHLKHNTFTNNENNRFHYKDKASTVFFLNIVSPPPEQSRG